MHPAANPHTWFPFLAQVNTPTLSTGGSQQPVQFSQPGVNFHNIGTDHVHRCNIATLIHMLIFSVGRMDSLLMESDTSRDLLYSGTPTNVSPDEEQAFLVNPPVTLLAHQLLGSSSEPQCGRSVNQAPRIPEANSQVLSASSSGTSGAPNTPLSMLSGQGGSAPETSRPQIGAPAQARNESINQIAGDTFLEEVVPEKGPMAGGIPIVIFGENFPAVPLYVGFGDNWVRAVSRARYHS